MYAKRFEIPRGETRRVALEFSMPKEEVTALILPSGRVRPVEYEVNGVATNDAGYAVAYWGYSVADPETPGAPAVAAILALVGALAVAVGARGTDPSCERPPAPAAPRTDPAGSVAGRHAVRGGGGRADRRCADQQLLLGVRRRQERRDAGAAWQSLRSSGFGDGAALGAAAPGGRTWPARPLV